MLTRGVVAAVVVSVLLALLLLILATLSCYFFYCCTVAVDGKSLAVSEVSFSVDSAKQRQFIKEIGTMMWSTNLIMSKESSVVSKDLELEVESKMKQSKNQLVQLEHYGDHHEDTHLEYGSANETFEWDMDHLIDDKAGSGDLISKKSNRWSTINYTTFDQGNTFLAKPLDKQTHADKHAGSSRTLMLQELLLDSLSNKENLIREVQDPFLESFISIGGIVVVVKPFYGKVNSEFNYLHTGDLLRVVKFYFKYEEITIDEHVHSLEDLDLTKFINDAKSSEIEIPFELLNDTNLLKEYKKTEQVESTITLENDIELVKLNAEALPRSSNGTPDRLSNLESNTLSFKGTLKLPVICNDESIRTAPDSLEDFNLQDIRFIKTDPNYSKIYCTGILLNSYLSYDNHNITLKIKEEKSHAKSEVEILKDFPLNVVSLETTLLKQISDTTDLE